MTTQPTLSSPPTPEEMAEYDAYLKSTIEANVAEMRAKKLLQPKGLKINIKDTDKVTEAIIRAEGRATARTVNHATATSLAAWAEKELKSMLPQSMWSGTVAHYLPPRVANSYDYRADGTFLSITRGSDAWFLTSVRRGNCGSCSHGSSARLDMKLSVKQQLYFVEKHPMLDKVIVTAKPQ